MFDPFSHYFSCTIFLGLWIEFFFFIIVCNLLFLLLVFLCFAASSSVCRVKLGFNFGNSSSGPFHS